MKQKNRSRRNFENFLLEMSKMCFWNLCSQEMEIIAHVATNAYALHLYNKSFDRRKSTLKSFQTFPAKFCLLTRAVF